MLKLIVRAMYLWSRRLHNIEILLSCDPKRIAKRQINRVIGRNIGRFFLK